MANRWGKIWNSDRFYFLGLKNHWGLWLQPWNSKALAPWKKSYDKPRQCIKIRDITLLTKVCLVKAMVFPVVMHICESWTIKKVECQRVDAFVLWCWWRLSRVAWTARRSNQSILNKFNPEYSLKGLMLKLQHFGQRANSLQMALMLEKIEDRKKRGPQKVRWLEWHHWLNGHEFKQTLGDGEWQWSVE